LREAVLRDGHLEGLAQVVVLQDPERRVGVEAAHDLLALLTLLLLLERVLVSVDVEGIYVGGLQ
jgi:hypothetical protein